MNKILKIAIIIISLIISNILIANTKSNNMIELFEKGKQLYGQREFKKAIGVFSKVLELNPKSSKAYSYRGTTYVQLKQYDNAISDYTKSIEIDSKQYPAYLSRGSVYILKMKYNEAINDFQKAIDLKPNEFKPDQFLAVSYSFLNDYDKCFYHIEQSVIKGFTDYDNIKNLIADEQIRYSYKVYKFILSLKIKYKYKTNIDHSIPFHELLLDLKDSSLGVNNNHKAKIFQEERNRLGKNFAMALERFIGDDIDRCYWISSYLSSDYYLHGNKPLYNLSLSITNKGIKLCEMENEVPPDIIGLSVVGALTAYKINNQKLARHYKAIVIKFLKKGGMYKYSFPALNENDKSIYDSIK